MKYILSSLLFFIFSIGFAQVDDSKSKKIITDVSNKIQSYKNIKIDFTHRMLDKANEVDESIDGVIIMQGESINLKMMGQTIISDGETMWSYNPDFEEVQIMSANDGGEALNFFELIINFDDSFKTQHIKTVNEGAKSLDVIDLRPKEGKAYYKIRVFVDTKNDLITRGTIYNKDNVEYHYKVNDIEFEGDYPASTFKFDKSKHPDAEVIDLR